MRIPLIPTTSTLILLIFGDLINDGVGAGGVRKNDSVSVAVPGALHKQLPHPTATITTRVVSPRNKKPSFEDEEDYDAYDDELDEADYLEEGSSKGPSKAAHKEWTEVACPHELDGRCHCGHQRDPNNRDSTRFLVNCTHGGFSDADFLKHIPQNTQVLIARGNNLRVLPRNIFERNLDLLKELDLSENSIQEIHGQTFHHVPNVDTLILNYNSIRLSTLTEHPRLFSNFYSLKYLHLTRAFEVSTDEGIPLLHSLQNVFIHSNLSHLLKLHLEQNGIGRVVDPRAFCSLHSLMDLHLGGNKLTELFIELDDPDEGDCLPVLRLVDLSYNEVREVGESSGLFSLLQHRNQREEPLELDLYMNPLQCTCALQPFVDWMRNATRRDPDRIRHQSALRCFGPPPLKGKILGQLKGRLECPAPEVRSANEVINRLSWVMVGILGGMLGLGGILLGLGKGGYLKGILVQKSPLLAGGSGVKYTSVDKEEGAEIAHV